MINKTSCLLKRCKIHHKSKIKPVQAALYVRKTRLQLITEDIRTIGGFMKWGKQRLLFLIKTGDFYSLITADTGICQPDRFLRLLVKLDA